MYILTATFYSTFFAFYDNPGARGPGPGEMDEITV